MTNPRWRAVHGQVLAGLDRTGEIAAETGLSTSYTSRALGALVDLGLVRKIGHGRYGAGPAVWPGRPSGRPKPVAVYRFFDAAGQLIYVGQTADPKERFRRHSAESDWWSEVAHRLVDWWPDKAAAVAEEARLVAEQSPRYNVQHSPVVVRARNRRRSGGSLEDIRAAMRGQRCVRTVILLGRLAERQPDIYDQWTPGDLGAFVSSHGFAVRKRLKGGQSCLVLEEVEAALAAGQQTDSAEEVA